MSCQIRTVASLIDVDTIKRHLFPSERKSVFDDSWDWSVEDTPKPNGKEIAWLQECSLSLSSTEEVLVIAHKKVMLILTSKWDSQEEGEVKKKYHITWLGNPCEEDEEITSVLCLPLITQGKSSYCGPDWTCIIIGLSSGYVRFYTENCSLLLSELLHDEPVTHLKCQSYEVARYSTAQEHNEELYVMYQSVVCVLMGFGLFQTLRACRNQLARVQANCGDMLRAPPLIYKKWGFTEQYKISDLEFVGPSTDNTFDHLVTASLRGGFNPNYRSSAPQTSLILAAGKKPYVGFHYAMEGDAPPVLSDVTKAVYSKVKSAFGQVVPSWIMGAKKPNSVEKSKEKITVEAAVSMGCRFGLCDHVRNGDRIVLSPNRNFSVVSDSLGRVILIDNLKGLAVRMWKGYRDAQCGWLEVQEETRQRGVGSRVKPRFALFLVIYVPRQGVIEIWAMQQGPKVAKFAASKSGRLLNIGYGLMGLNKIPLKGGNKPQFQCVFIDPSGLIKEISVPFHFALSDKNSKRARDLHLLKKLKTFLKEDDYDDEKLVEEVQKTMQDLKTNDIRTQAIEMLSTSKYISPSALEVALIEISNKLNGQDPNTLDHNSKTLLQMSQQLQKLVSFYRFIHEQNEIPPTYNTVVADDLSSPKSLSSILHASEREVNGLRKLISTIDIVTKKKKSRSEARVGFVEDGKTAFIEFLSCFDVEHTLQENLTVNLKKNISVDKLRRNSELIYQGTLYNDTNVEEWKNAAAESCIQPGNLMHLALQFWLQKKEGAALEAEMIRFVELLKAICSLADIDTICAEYNEQSSWWRDVRNILKDSANPFMALTGAIVCRAVALDVEKEKEYKNHSCDIPMTNATDSLTQQQESCATSPDDETHSSTSEWENVSRDTCQWSLLIGQLEDVALLDTVLGQKPPSNDKDGGQISPRPYLFCCPYDRPSVSLSYVLQKGKGSVSELVARWLSSTGIDPCRLVDLSDVEFDNVEQQNQFMERNRFKKSTSIDIKEGSMMDVEEGAEVTPLNGFESEILANLSTLKHHFPYSLTSSIILVNLCWEYMLTWHRNVDELETLYAAVKCLQAIPSPHLTEGLCSLIWTMHLRQKFESVAKLFQKVGKTPKERLCRQEIGISDLEMTSFLDTVMTFLDTFMEANLMSGAQTPFNLKYEELWNCGVIGPPPLTELALAQPGVNYELLHLQHQLATAFHMMSAFSMRFPRPLTSLFDNAGQAALFADLTSKPQLPSHNPDVGLITIRTNFLNRIISGATQSIQKLEWDENCPDEKVTKFDARNATKWMSKCYNLAFVWQVSSDSLRRHQICELYSNGCDRLAEELIPAIEYPTVLASQLLLIVGHRLKQIVMNSPDMRDKMSYLSPSLSTWLDSLNEDNTKNNSNTNLTDLSQLLALIMQHLPEEHQEYHLALHMEEAVQAFISASKVRSVT